jgi:hypothetical protein
MQDLNLHAKDITELVLVHVTVRAQMKHYYLFIWLSGTWHKILCVISPQGAVNGNNTLEEEITERIAKGNRAFYANKTLFKSKMVSRKSKLKLCWSVITPIVVYGFETWVLKESIIERI